MIYKRELFFNTSRILHIKETLLLNDLKKKHFHADTFPVLMTVELDIEIVEFYE